MQIITSRSFNRGKKLWWENTLSIEREPLPLSDRLKRGNTITLCPQIWGKSAILRDLSRGSRHRGKLPVKYPPKTLAFQWMAGFTAGAGAGRVTVWEHPDLQKAWNDGFCS